MGDLFWNSIAVSVKEEGCIGLKPDTSDVLFSLKNLKLKQLRIFVGQSENELPMM